MRTCAPVVWRIHNVDSKCWIAKLTFQLKMCTLWGPLRSPFRPKNWPLIGRFKRNDLLALKNVDSLNFFPNESFRMKSFVYSNPRNAIQAKWARFRWTIIGVHWLVGLKFVDLAPCNKRGMAATLWNKWHLDHQLRTISASKAVLCTVW